MKTQKIIAIEKKPNARILLGDRIYMLRKAKKLTQRQLAKSVCVSHVTISQWESADTLPKGIHLIALCSALDCTPTYLIHGADKPMKTSKPCSIYPVLSNLQLGIWHDPRFVATTSNISTWIGSDEPLNGSGFWYKVENDAMQTSMGVSIPEGAYVLFDTALEAKTNDIVIVKKNGRDQPILRKLVVDGGKIFLSASNPTWPTIILDEHVQSMYVAVEFKFKFQKDNLDNN